MLEAERLFDLQLLEHVKLLSLLNPSSYTLDVPVVYDELLLPVQPDINLGAQMAISYQIFDNNGGAVLHSRDASTDNFAPFDIGYHDVNFAGYRWRALVIQDPDDQHWVMAAQRYDVRYQLAESVILEAVIPTVLSIPLAGILIWFIIGYGLRPIAQLAKEVQSREASDLSSVELENVPKELAPLTRSTNELLRRLQSSFAREKRFAADTAHELRTPISILKVQVHNLLNELQEPHATLNELRAGIDSMGHLVEQILVLNRTAPDQYMVQFVSVDLYEIAKEVVSSEFEQILRRNQTFELIGEPALVRGDATALRSLLLNILANASKYTPENGQIRMLVRINAEQVLLAIEDSGPGIPESHHERVFDRFYRLDGDRHPTEAGGSGLGLSIVKHIVDMHGGSVNLSRSEELGGLCVTIVLDSITTGGLA